MESKDRIIKYGDLTPSKPLVGEDPYGEQETSIWYRPDAKFVKEFEEVQNLLQTLFEENSVKYRTPPAHFTLSYSKTYRNMFALVNAEVEDGTIKVNNCRDLSVEITDITIGEPYPSGVSPITVKVVLNPELSQVLNMFADEFADRAFVISERDDKRVTLTMALAYIDGSTDKNFLNESEIDSELSDEQKITKQIISNIGEQILVIASKIDTNFEINDHLELNAPEDSNIANSDEWLPYKHNQMRLGGKVSGSPAPFPGL